MQRFTLIGWMALAVALVGCPDGDPADSGDNGNGATGATTGETTGGETTGAAACKTDTDCQTPGATASGCQVAVCDPTLKTCGTQSAENGAACDDSDPCTEADQCQSGQCKGAMKACDDQNPCTNDSCDPSGGTCTSIPNAALCDDGLFCTVNDQCNDGACKGAPNPQCECQVDADCAQFDDGDLCNGVLACTDNKCVPKAGTAVVCPESDQACQSNACDPKSGECALQPKAEGTQCDDGDACTTSDACAAGACQGTALSCDDQNPCTDDSCAVETGCVFAPNTAACDDGDLCTTADVCTNGGCAGEVNADCQCGSDADCAAFEDGDLCNGTLSCQDGACVVAAETVVDCTSLAEALKGGCKVAVCNAATGECETDAALDGTTCDDQSLCTDSDHCAEGVCTGNAITCTDDNPCTKDGCNPGLGCVFDPEDGAACDDNNACTQSDVCTGGICAGSGDCQCATAADCVGFEDGDLCNGTLTCLEGACVVAPGTVVTCEGDGVNPCVTTECVPETGDCLSKPANDGTACDDESVCTTASFCADGKCTGKPKSCDDGNLCTDDGCDPQLGCVHNFNDAACDDGNAATTGDVCQAGLCKGTPTVADSCETDGDCAAFGDGNLCNGALVCVAGKCVVDPATVVSCPQGGDEQDGCMVLSCVPETGACEPQPAADGKTCDDGDACTLDNTCVAGVCSSTQKLNCDDGNPCTIDTCVSEFGCVLFANDGASCDDGDSCSEGDQCADFYCQPGQTNACEGQCQARVHLPCNYYHSWNTGLEGSTQTQETYGCNDDTYPGPEFTYYFEAPFDGTMNVSLTGESSITDVMVLEATDAGCEATGCVDWGFAGANTAMEAGKSYYFVVDGFLDEPGDYTITLTCTPAVESNCADGVDDDADGQTDCDDSDCADAEGCAVSSCDVAAELVCGGEDIWATYLEGTTNAVETYQGCDNPWSYPAPEYTYGFTATADGPVTVTLKGETSETDIMVLTAGDADACDASGCLAYGFGEVTFDATKGQRYHLVVDGFNGAEGIFEIYVACDGDVIPAVEACTPPAEMALSCGGTVTLTNDDLVLSGDGATEYSCSTDLYGGPEVAGRFVADFTGDLTVTLSGESAETDVFIIPDSDGICDPTACVANGFDSATWPVLEGQSYWVVVDGYDGAVGEFTLDVACAPVASPDTELCTGGVDEDGDGATDCEDPDCFGVSDLCATACVPSDGAPALTCLGDALTHSHNNGGEGSHALANFYSCSGDTYEAPEFVYTYVALEDGPVTVALTGESADTDVMVLADKGLGCNPASCLVTGYDSATFDGVMGETYYVVVDGWQDAVGDYTLTFTCGAN